MDDRAPSEDDRAPADDVPADDADERVGDALRTAVERTLAATAGSASETRQRARELLDEVTRRGEVARGEISRRGEVARDEISRRGDAARQEVVRRRDVARGEVARVGEEASSRLADAIADLRQASREDLGSISDRIGAIERRLGDLEHALRGDRGPTEVAGQKPHEQSSQVGQSQAKPEVEGSPSEDDSGG